MPRILGSAIKLCRNGRLSKNGCTACRFTPSNAAPPRVSSMISSDSRSIVATSSALKSCRSARKPNVSKKSFCSSLSSIPCPRRTRLVHYALLSTFLPSVNSAPSVVNPHRLTRSGSRIPTPPCPPAMPSSAGPRVRGSAQPDGRRTSSPRRTTARAPSAPRSSASGSS